MTVAWLIALAMGWSSYLHDGRENEAEQIAWAVSGCGEREALDPLMVLAIIAQESSFRADPCSRRVQADRILSRTPVEGHDDREEIEWQCGSGSSTRRSCKRVAWEIAACGDYLCFNVCPAGEVGYMQVLWSSTWARSGLPIPGTEEDVSFQADGTRVNFVFSTADRTRETCAVLVDGERLARSAFEVIDNQVVLDEAPAAGATVVVAEALSPVSRDRRAQLLRPRENIALGCAELADHREEAGKTSADPWWTWVGAYNTGTARGEGARRYARTILRRYLDFCAAVVPTEAGDFQLRDVYEACSAAVDAHADLVED